MVAKRKNQIFFTGGALPLEYGTYCNRSNIDNRAIRKICDRQKVVYIYGTRQTGKTSLLLRLQEKLHKLNWTCCFIDLAEMKALEPAIWFQRLGETIAANFKITPAMMKIKPEDQMQFKSFLLDEIGLAKQQNPIQLALIFDEIEGLLEHKFSDAFLMTLRNLYQQTSTSKGQLVMAFGGNTRPYYLKRKDDTSPFNIAEVFRLEDFSEKESRELTGHLDKLSAKVEDIVHSHIYSWACGHPYLTHRICELLEGMVDNESLEVITPDIVDRVISDSLSSAEQEDPNITRIDAKIKSLQSPPADLWQRLAMREKVSKNEIGYETLYKTGVVKSGKNNEICIRNKIYEKVLLGIDRANIFISYSRKDKKWLIKLQDMLRPLIRLDLITVWADTKIEVGDRWREKTQKALESAKIAVLLVSPDFLASDFINEFELLPLITAAEKKGLKIFWIPISASVYEKTELNNFQAAYDPSRPLDTLTSAQQNLALVEICKKICDAADA